MWRHVLTLKNSLVDGWGRIQALVAQAAPRISPADAGKVGEVASGQDQSHEGSVQGRVDVFSKDAWFSKTGGGGVCPTPRRSRAEGP